MDYVLNKVIRPPIRAWLLYSSVELHLRYSQRQIHDLIHYYSTPHFSDLSISVYAPVMLRSECFFSCTHNHLKGTRMEDTWSPCAAVSLSWYVAMTDHDEDRHEFFLILNLLSVGPSLAGADNRPNSIQIRHLVNQPTLFLRLQVNLQDLLLLLYLYSSDCRVCIYMISTFPSWFQVW